MTKLPGEVRELNIQPLGMEEARMEKERGEQSIPPPSPNKKQGALR